MKNTTKTTQQQIQNKKRRMEDPFSLSGKLADPQFAVAEVRLGDWPDSDLTEAMPEVAADRGVAVGQPEAPGKHAEDAELHAGRPGGKQADRQDAEDNLKPERGHERRCPDASCWSP